MPDRVPLIYNPSANQIQELASSDSLDLSGVNVNAGVATATVFSHPSTITGAVLLLDPTRNYFHVGNVAVAVGSTIAVGVGVTYFVVSSPTT